MLATDRHTRINRLARIGRLRGPCALFCAGLLFFAAAVCLQYRSGTYQAEFGGHADEPSHYVTGLMLHDYVSARFPGRPLRFAEDYYLHYPKVALGHWPPVFYVIEAAWMGLFSSSRPSLLLMMAVFAALLASTLYRVARAEFGAKAGVAAGLLVISIPLAQTYTAMVMVEVPLALFALWAALSFGSYLDTERWQDAARFGLLASLAIMTKGNGLALALLPPIALLLARRLRLARKPSLWLAALFPVVICGPWYALTLGMARNTWLYEPGLAFAAEAIRFYSVELFKAAGVPLGLLALAGIYAQVAAPLRRPRERAMAAGASVDHAWVEATVEGPTTQARGRWVASGALLASVLVFQSLVPAGLERRLLLPALPPLVLFVIAGFQWVLRRPAVARWAVPARGQAFASVFIALFAFETFSVPRQAHRGYAEAVEDLLARPDLAGAVFLVSSQTDGEGIFIAEVAMRDNRPRHIVLRASKVLSQSDWAGENYSLLYRTPEQAMRFLDSVPVSIVVLDLTPGKEDLPHNRQLLSLIHGNPGRWKLLGLYPLEGSGAAPGIRVYEITGNENRQAGKIRIDMRNMLGRFIEK